MPIDWHQHGCFPTAMHNGGKTGSVQLAGLCVSMWKCCNEVLKSQTEVARGFKHNSRAF
jgi:hypothetical protein